MKKYKILVVDDERPLAEMIALNFSDKKFEVQTCHTGKEALHYAEHWRPNVMILDVMMGDMDGWEVLTALRLNPATASVPVIMCTARDGPEDVQKSFKYGAQSFIIKPINFPKLMTKVAAILDIQDLLNS